MAKKDSMKTINTLKWPRAAPKDAESVMAGP